MADKLDILMEMNGNYNLLDNMHEEMMLQVY